MSEVNNTVDAVDESGTQEGVNPALDGAKPGRFESVEDAAKRVEQLEAEQAKNAELLKKLRKFEKENAVKAEDALKEQGKWKDIAEAHAAKLAELETKFRDRALTGALNEALKESKAKSISTVMKLIDKSLIKVEGDEVDAKSIQAVIKGLKESDPILFDIEEKPTAPPVKRASEGAPISGFEQEIKACKTAKDIENVMRKYGKL